MDVGCPLGRQRVLGAVESVVAQLWTDPRPPAYVAPKRPLLAPPAAYLGVWLGPTLGEGGCGLMDVLPDTPAARSGLKPGDVIVRWSGQLVSNPAALLSRMGAARPGEEVKLKVRRAGRLIEVKLKLGRR